MFQANMADSFGSAVTPFQIGGGAAMIFVLNRGGVSYANGLSVCVATFVMSLLLILISSAISVVLLQDHFSNLFLDYLLNYSLVIFLIILIIIFLSLLKPDFILNRINYFVLIKIKTSKRYFLHFLQFIKSILLVCKEYNSTCKQLIHSYPNTLFISFI